MGGSHGVCSGSACSKYLVYPTFLPFYYTIYNVSSEPGWQPESAQWQCALITFYYPLIMFYPTILGNDSGVNDIQLSRNKVYYNKCI